MNFKKKREECPNFSLCFLYTQIEPYFEVSDQNPSISRWNIPPQKTFFLKAVGPRNSQLLVKTNTKRKYVKLHRIQKPMSVKLLFW